MSDTTPKAEGAVIFEFPGKIAGGKCTNCQKDVSWMFAGIERGEIKPPGNCPNCGTSLIPGSITKLVLLCGKCNNEITNPRKTKHCTNCGVELAYPEGTQTKTEADPTD